MTNNPFDLAKAKAGHPVQTASGSPARIVCFDAKGPEPLVVLISEDDPDSPYFGFEMAWQFRGDGLTCDWGKSNYVNPPFGSIVHQGKKKGMTAWVRKAIAEQEKGNDVVMVYPVDKWLLMLVKAGAEIRNLGDVKWVATEDGSPGKGTGRHIACFVLKGLPQPTLSENREP